MNGRIRSRLAAAPTEGWISLGLVAIMAVAVAWSLDDAALVLGNRAWTDFLPWVTLAGIVARYLSYPTNAMGPEAKRLLGDLQARVKASGRTTPYDVATMVVNELHKSTYRYDTNVTGVCDRAQSIVECFAVNKVGFCEHFATTMVILLRAQGIPARLVEGFLPGTVDVATGRELIRTDGAHAWVEVYFPGIGWYLFDPTGGLDSTEAIPVGSPRPIPTARPIPSLVLGSRAPDDEEGPSARRGQAPPAGAGNNGSNTPAFVAISVILLAAIVLVAFLAWRRGPRGAMTPEGMYASVAGLARRFGFGPRPTQTTYEYATALGDVLPGVRPELQTVAAAKVEVAYGRRELGDDRIKSLREAYRRLRVGLLRLAFRRGDRRRMR